MIFHIKLALMQVLMRDFQREIKILVADTQLNLYVLYYRGMLFAWAGTEEEKIFKRGKKGGIVKRAM